MVTRGLLSQSFPSTTTSIDSDLSGHVSTPRHALDDPYDIQGQEDTHISESYAPGNFVSTSAATTFSVTPATLTPDMPQISRRSAISIRSSEWDSMYTQSSPSSYDETTRGQPPSLQLALV
ncbi:hypothetical protein CVT25_004430 [Psilocybe cyanescens]|uniref:Uncharacterized protein n=1 Tax=Psilocybe cyanescens TaxID=93625 RepID=A0A409W1X2_PSICY|nr:hypothetical protein CVT25_004430 [Psilocybe cyanescens]